MFKFAECVIVRVCWIWPFCLICLTSFHCAIPPPLCFSLAPPPTTWTNTDACPTRACMLSWAWFISAAKTWTAWWRKRGIEQMRPCTSLPRNVQRLLAFELCRFGRLGLALDDVMLRLTICLFLNCYNNLQIWYLRTTPFMGLHDMWNSPGAKIFASSCCCFLPCQV